MLRQKYPNTYKKTEQERETKLEKKKLTKVEKEQKIAQDKKVYELKRVEQRKDEKSPAMSFVKVLFKTMMGKDVT